jgi:hypothetical protein
MTTADRPAAEQTRVERFLGHLDALTGGAEPVFIPVPSTKAGLPGVTVMAYRELPDPAMFTAVTYGVSLASHEEWQLGKPGRLPLLSRRHRNFKEQITPDTQMTAFVVFAPVILPQEGYSGIDVGDSLPVDIAGCYPIHESERHYIHEHGLKAFWELYWDPYDVQRPPEA